MLRKFMAAVALCSVPVLSFGVAEVATTGSAFAAGGTTLCSGGSQTVTFAAPGISNQGTASAEREVSFFDVCIALAHLHRKACRQRHGCLEQDQDQEHGDLRVRLESAVTMPGG